MLLYPYASILRRIRFRYFVCDKNLIFFFFFWWIQIKMKNLFFNQCLSVNQRWWSGDRVKQLKIVIYYHNILHPEKYKFYCRILPWCLCRWPINNQTIFFSNSLFHFIISEIIFCHFSFYCFSVRFCFFFLMDSFFGI